ncbi:MAG: glycosyltransferase [Gammaproteobacteria bacterium]|nr:glycosyltransferase [Gammaproteobacteria bacterium]
MSVHNHGSRYAIVIPAYNEEATIHDVVQRALNQCNKVIVVDDGSSDNTIARLDGLPVTIIKHETNQGKAASLWDGFMAAMAHDINFVITLDGDNQHSPEDIPLLIEKNKSHPDQIIIGARLADKSLIPAKRYYANKVANFWIAWAAGYPLSDSQSGFRLYPVALFDRLSISTSKNCSFVFESEIIIKAAQRGIHSYPVPIPAVYAENARPSHFRGVRDITLITLMVAKSLLSRGFYLQGLYRSAFKPILLPSQKKADYDSYLMMIFSIFFIMATGGISLLLSWVYIFQGALKNQQDTSNIKTSLILGKRLINKQPDSEFIKRLERARILYSEMNIVNIYILGGMTRNSDISEASAGKKFLVKEGVNPESIFLEEESRNTLENLKHLSHIPGIKSQPLSLITNRYHLARSLVMSKGFGLNIKPYPAEDKLPYTPIYIFKTLTEAFYLHWYLAGKYWAHLTNNMRMLDRIS